MNGPGPDISGITPEMRAALHARGVTDDVIALLTPEDAEKFIRTHTPEAALKLFNGGAATDRFEPTTEAAPAYTFLDPESADALMQRYGPTGTPLPSQDLDEGISDQPTAQESLNANGIYLENYNPGQRSNATCPECSRDSLSVKIDEKGATWYCHHCKWKRPKKGQHAAEPDTEQAVAALPSTVWIELTKFTKTGGPLTKQISLSRNGTLEKDGSACVMARGKAERVRVANVHAFGALIEDMASSQAIALGALRADLLDSVEVTTKKKLVNGVERPDVITRTGANIVYHGRAFALLDYDSEGMPTSVAVELKRAGGFWDALLTVLPDLSGVARVTRRSTSAGLSRSDTGEALPESDGVHVYIAEKDGADSERFLRALHERCWLAGFGWMIVSTSGALLERSIVDRTVGGPERLVFEGDPVLRPPLRQDKESRRPTAADGVVLDTVAACPLLSIVERARLDELKARERARLAPEMANAREAFVEAQAKKLVARTGMSEKAARQVIVRQCEGVLRPDIVLPFDDPELAGCTVRDVLADPEGFQDETLADP